MEFQNVACISINTIHLNYSMNIHIVKIWYLMPNWESNFYKMYPFECTRMMYFMTVIEMVMLILTVHWEQVWWQNYNENGFQIIRIHFSGNESYWFIPRVYSGLLFTWSISNLSLDVSFGSLFRIGKRTGYLWYSLWKKCKLNLWLKRKKITDRKQKK